MREVIITGCAGLLGSHLSRHLISKGYKVIGIDDLSGGYSDYLPECGPDQFEFWPLDLSDGKWTPKALEHIFIDPKRDIAACFHFAAYAAEGLSPFIRHFNYTNNILSSVNIINQCISYNVKLIFTSSMAVYGNQKTPYLETMTPQPIDPYGVAKYAIEQDIKIASSQHGLRYTIARPHNVIGIYQNIWDKYRNVVGIFIRKALDGEPILVYGDGEQTRAFSDIDYYMEPFEKMINDHDGLTVNLGADKSYTINELAETVKQCALQHGFDVDIKHVEARHEVKHADCDHSLAKEKLGFYDGTNLQEMVAKMFAWAKDQPKREQKKMNYEVKKGMYEYWK